MRQANNYSSIQHLSKTFFINLVRIKTKASQSSRLTSHTNGATGLQIYQQLYGCLGITDWN